MVGGLAWRFPHSSAVWALESKHDPSFAGADTVPEASTGRCPARHAAAGPQSSENLVLGPALGGDRAAVPVHGETDVGDHSRNTWLARRISRARHHRAGT